MLASKASKAWRLLPLVFTSPLEFYDRIHTVIQVRASDSIKRATYHPLDMSNALGALEAAAGLNISSHFEEKALLEIEEVVKKRWSDLKNKGPFDFNHNGDHFLARTCYSVVRALKPQTVIETGVCYGVTSSFLLQAIHENGSGRLHSIDLPPLGKDADQYVGALVPESLRSSWDLHRGNALRLLPPLLSELGSIDLFCHDSLHTYSHMKMEFAKAWPTLRSGGILISDDVEGNTAFEELCALPDVYASVVMKFSDGPALFGAAIKN